MGHDIVALIREQVLILRTRFSKKTRFRGENLTEGHIPIVYLT
jgi:hypothetical protein